MNDNKNSRCSLCGARNLKILGIPQISEKLKDHIKEDYHVFRCDDCNFYFVLPRIEFSKQEWGEFYDSEYFKDMTGWSVVQRKKDRKDRLDALQGYSAQKKPKFLDIGCGNGDVMTDAVVRNWNVHGLDIADNRRPSVKTANISFFPGDLFHAKFKDDYFDCIYLDSVLEHVDGPLAYLKEINRIIKKGGILYIGVPNEDSLFNYIKTISYLLSGKRKISAKLKPFNTPYHINGFTKRSLAIAAEKSGFEIVRLRDFAGQAEFLNFKVFSRPFMINTLFMPAHMIAKLFKMQIYLEAIFRK